ncbi:MAG TPA: histidine kinase [Chitinophagaceae bacterium]|jgi:biotin transporter BioY|nr:histidine kinase [Chitinophagaceae bacterium]
MIGVPAQQPLAVSKADNKTFLWICLFAAVPVYWAALYYIEAVTRQEIEELAVAATLSFFGCFYIGWVMGRHWGKSIRDFKPVLTALAVMMLVLLLWLFVHADFPLERWPALNLLLFWLPFLMLSTATGLLVRLTRISVARQLEQAGAAVAHSRSELQLLQSQLSPHFLFNTLNNLYGLSLTQHQLIPPLLLKLSELLRYSVYDAKELWVPLADELNYIRNYIEFEKIRMGDRLQLQTAIEEVTGKELKIAPMLLIVFIENAFKHSRNTTDKEVYIELELKLWQGTLLFSVRNSFAEGSEPRARQGGREGGLGLKNARKRLQLLYPDRHALMLEAKNGTYTATLQLNIREHEPHSLPDRR